MFLKRSLFRLTKISSISSLLRDAWLAQSVELVILDLGDVGSSPRLGVQSTISHLLRAFIINGCGIFSDFFSASIDIIWFSLLM